MYKVEANGMTWTFSTQRKALDFIQTMLIAEEQIMITVYEYKETRQTEGKGE